MMCLSTLMRKGEDEPVLVAGAYGAESQFEALSHFCWTLTGHFFIACPV